MNQSFEYHFEWDPIKAQLNYKKHGIAFERSATVFDDPNALSIYDDAHSFHEERWITLGIDFTGSLLVVCHTFKEEDEHNVLIRIISSRKATGRETRQYKEI